MYQGFTTDDQVWQGPDRIPAIKEALQEPQGAMSSLEPVARCRLDSIPGHFKWHIAISPKSSRFPVSRVKPNIPNIGKPRFNFERIRLIQVEILFNFDSQSLRDFTKLSIIK